MAPAKEAVSVGHAARCGDGARPTELRKRCLRPDPCRVVAGHDHHFSRGVSADAERFSQRWDCRLRVTVLLAVAFACIALGLTTIGVYGLLAQRSRVCCKS